MGRHLGAQASRVADSIGQGSIDMLFGFRSWLATLGLLAALSGSWVYAQEEGSPAEPTLAEQDSPAEAVVASSDAAAEDAVESPAAAEDAEPTARRSPVRLNRSNLQKTARRALPKAAVSPWPLMKSAACRPGPFGRRVRAMQQRVRLTGTVMAAMALILRMST